MTTVVRYIFKSEGVTTTLGETDFEPWFLTVDKRNGDIFVSSSSGIYKWTAEGSTQITTGNFRGIVVDKEGNLYAADQILNGIVNSKLVLGKQRI